MWFQYIFAALLIIAFVVFFLRKTSQKDHDKRVINKKRRNSKALIHSESGLTMDDHYRLDKRQKELELNSLLDKVNSKGWENLSSKEQERLKELSNNI